MDEESFQFTIEPWTVVQENKEYQTPIFNLLRRRMILESDTEQLAGDFYVLDAPEWTNVIPITADKEVVLVEQYRYGIEQPTLEIPGGMVDGAETPRTAAARELLEETGYHSGQWSSLGTISANPAIMNNRTHLFLAEQCVLQSEPNFDHHERINIHLLPVDQFLDYVADGTIHHSIVVAAVARYLLSKK